MISDLEGAERCVSQGKRSANHEGKSLLRLIGYVMAEAVGFEPTEPFGSLVFKTSALNHSATLPGGDQARPEPGYALPCRGLVGVGRF